MALPLYLAMTPAEILSAGPEVSCLGYMACHFSPYGRELSNLPEVLPEGAMLILDDSTPFDGHDHRLIVRQLTEQIPLHRCRCVLLDFEREDSRELQVLAAMLCEASPCPVGVPAPYARELSCPVFLPPVPPDRPLKDHLAPWAGREIWLEAALHGLTLTLTEKGCSTTPLFDFPGQGLKDDRLHCHYTIEFPAAFRLWRTRADLDELLKEAEMYGVANAVGLWQELGQ